MLIGILGRHGFQQRSRVLQVGRREAFREGFVDGRQSCAGIAAAILSLLEPGETHRSPQLPALALLPHRGLDRPSEALFGGAGVVGRLGQKQQARTSYQRAGELLKKYEYLPAEVSRWHAEAVALLELKEPKK